MKEWLNELKKIIPSELKIHDYSGVVRNHDFFMIKTFKQTGCQISFKYNEKR